MSYLRMRDEGGMRSDEIVRRLRALHRMSPLERPISMRKLSDLAGLDYETLIDVARTGRMIAKTQARLSVALRALEEGRVRVERRPGKPDLVTIGEARPEQKNVLRVVFGPRGPNVAIQPLNPNRFDVPDQTGAK